MSATKPTKGQILASGPLSIVPLSADRMACCNVCGKPAELYEAWRACDERDRPIPGDAALIFLGAGEEHQACHEKLEAHPRMFTEVEGHLGCLPRLCGPCTFRRGLDCMHPDAKRNGGTGLRIDVSGFGGVVCGRGGCRTILQPALACAGRTVRETEKAGAAKGPGMRLAERAPAEVPSRLVIEAMRGGR